MIKDGCKLCVVYPFDLSIKRINKTSHNVGKSHYKINVFLQNTLATIIGTPRFFFIFFMSKISLKYIFMNI